MCIASGDTCCTRPFVISWLSLSHHLLLASIHYLPLSLLWCPYLYQDRFYLQLSAVLRASDKHTNDTEKQVDEICRRSLAGNATSLHQPLHHRFHPRRSSTSMRARHSRITTQYHPIPLLPDQIRTTPTRTLTPHHGQDAPQLRRPQVPIQHFRLRYHQHQIRKRYSPTVLSPHTPHCPVVHRHCRDRPSSRRRQRVLRTLTIRRRALPQEKRVRCHSHAPEIGATGRHSRRARNPSCSSQVIMLRGQTQEGASPSSATTGRTRTRRWSTTSNWI